MSHPRHIIIGRRTLLPLFLAGILAARATEPTAAPAATVDPGKADPDSTIAAARAGKPVDVIKNFVRAYEATELGLTRDKAEETFLDFKFSLMFPLLGEYADPSRPPAESAPWKRLGVFDTDHVALFFSGTIRGGQYIWSRPSAPVVEKRFNPQVFVRLWAVQDGRTDLDKYFDLIYGHESNGQSITTEDRFNEQMEIYRRLEGEPDSPAAVERARRSARDTISRGWDYVGAEWSWAWPARFTVRGRSIGISQVMRLKLRYFLSEGFLQQGAEEYHDWEGDGPRHRRQDYDGVMLQYTGVLQSVAKAAPVLTGRYQLTYTTGLTHAFRHSTAQLDLGASAWSRPFSFWYRWGYNSDLTDYYRHTKSFGFKISIWEY